MYHKFNENNKSHFEKNSKQRQKHSVKWYQDEGFWALNYGWVSCNVRKNSTQRPVLHSLRNLGLFNSFNKPQLLTPLPSDPPN